MENTCTEKNPRHWFVDDLAARRGCEAKISVTEVNRSPLEM